LAFISPDLSLLQPSEGFTFSSFKVNIGKHYKKIAPRD
jgi:hypothetical protein